VSDELFPDAFHDTARYANNRIENDHGRLKARLKPMRGLRTDRTASNVIRGHAFVQNLPKRSDRNPSTNRTNHTPRSTNATVPFELGDRAP